METLQLLVLRFAASPNLYFFNFDSVFRVKFLFFFIIIFVFFTRCHHYFSHQRCVDLVLGNLQTHSIDFITNI